MKIIRPIVFIGIVTFNSERHVAKCLSMIRKQTYPNIQTIVLDNNSSDFSSRLIRKYIRKEKFIQSKVNIGYGMGHNAIIRACHPRQKDYYMPLNPDVVLNPSYVSNLVTELKNNNADWGIGKLYCMDSYHHSKKTIYSTGHALLSNGYAINIGNGMLDDDKQFISKEVFGAPGAAPLYTGKLIHSIAYKEGLFDKQMFMYYEDVDVDWRARLNGFRCWYASTATGYHLGSTAQGRINTQALANRYLSVIKNAHAYDLFVYNSIVIFCHCVFKLCTEPTEGIWLIQQLVKTNLYALKRRTSPKVPRSYMAGWFLLNKHQLTLQPKTILQRLMYYFNQQH